MLKYCDSRQSFQRMAKDLIFIHDYFCFVVYKNSELEPIPLVHIQNYVGDTSSDVEGDVEVDLDAKNDEKNIVKLAKEYISKHLADDQEETEPNKTKSQKLIPLELNLIPLICFIALKVVNYPVFPKDIYNWIKNQTMPYFSAHLEISNETL